MHDSISGARRRSPGLKLLFAVLVAAAVAVPLMMVYALVWDRQEQSRNARAAITQGWGGPQVVTGPVLVIPWRDTATETVVTDGRPTERVTTVIRELYLAPEKQTVVTQLAPERRAKSIYESVIYRATMGGEARFRMPADLERQGVDRERLILSRAELRFGVSDPRGLQSDSRITANGTVLEARPGKGLGASGNSGFFAFVDWGGAEELAVDWSYGLRGSESIALVPRGGDTQWRVRSGWPHPSFAGSFLPARSTIAEDGFTALFAIPDLALGQGLVMTGDAGPPIIGGGPQIDRTMVAAPMVEGPGRVGGDWAGGPSMAASVALVEPVDLYSRVERSVKYGFLIIGFTFLALLMFDIIAGARVAVPEFLLTGVGLVLFFVLLLAFAEVIGFTAAYAGAAGAIIALITAYSAAVLRSWKRAKAIGALLVGLYVLLFVLLSLEAWSLMIGSVLLFFALAAVMYATRRVDWSSGAGRDEAEEG